MERSRWILDIEHDLQIISRRLHTLENYFEDDGLIAQLAAAVHRLAVKIEAMEGDERAHGDGPELR